MARPARILGLAAPLCALLECAPPYTAEPGRSTGEDGGGSSTSTATSAGSTGIGPTGADDSSGGSAGNSGSVTGEDGDKGTPAPVGTTTCDVFAQDCPSGQKCTWTLGETETGCVPLASDPKQAGEPCTWDPDAPDGELGWDDCALGAICFGFGDGGPGACVELCKGSYSYPYCDPGEVCFGGRVVFTCAKTCDPVIQDCPADHRCIFETYAGFVCEHEIHDDSEAGLGEPCTWEWDCAPGLACAWGSAIKGCASDACCTEYCDPSNPGFICHGESQTCPPFEWDDPQQDWPPNVGFCEYTP